MARLCRARGGGKAPGDRRSSRTPPTAATASPTARPPRSPRPRPARPPEPERHGNRNPRDPTRGGVNGPALPGQRGREGPWGSTKLKDAAHSGNGVANGKTAKKSKAKAGASARA